MSETMTELAVPQEAVKALAKWYSTKFAGIGEDGVRSISTPVVVAELRRLACEWEREYRNLEVKRERREHDCGTPDHGLQQFESALTQAIDALRDRADALERTS